MSHDIPPVPVDPTSGVSATQTVARASRILLLYFSQTGDSKRVAELMAEPFVQRGDAVQCECLKPMQSYPFPWRNPIRFFAVLPECLLGPVPAMQPVSFDATAKFELIILVYPVWFLSPSLPVQGFLASSSANVLHGRPVVTVSVSRNMWHSASERMKVLLREVGAQQIDQVVVTHQGPPWATFITTPRVLLWGKSEPFWGVFPAAGLGDKEFDRVQRIAKILRERWERRSADGTESLLQNCGAVQINQRYMIPEAIGWYLFMAWAYVLRGLSYGGQWFKVLGICGFMLFLVCIVGIGIPIITVVTWLVLPFIRPAMDAYARHLAAPSGTAIAPSAGPVIGLTGSHDE